MCDLRKRLPVIIFVVWTGCAFCAQAEGISVTLGQPDFEPGSFPTIEAFNAASVGEPAPFDGIRGNDEDGPSFSASWTYSYPPTPIGLASLTLGITDHDSQAPGSQVYSFSLDGIDLTSLIDEALEGWGGTQREYNVYTLDLPPSVFAALTDGTAVFELTLQGPGLGGYPGEVETTLPYNSAGLDFATLTTEVPEPTALVLLVLNGLVALRPRRRWSS